MNIFTRILNARAQWHQHQRRHVRTKTMAFRKVGRKMLLFYASAQYFFARESWSCFDCGLAFGIQMGLYNMTVCNWGGQHRPMGDLCKSTNLRIERNQPKICASLCKMRHYRLAAITAWAFVMWPNDGDDCMAIFNCSGKRIAQFLIL